MAGRKAPSTQRSTVLNGLQIPLKKFVEVSAENNFGKSKNREPPAVYPLDCPLGRKDVIPTFVTET